MAIVPLKQTVTISRQGVVDRWGNPVEPAQEIELKCRFSEGVKLTRRTSAQSGAAQTLSEEVVSTAQIYFDKFADVRLDDVITYVDESGSARTYSPLSIERKRAFNGSVLLTVVNV